MNEAIEINEYFALDKVIRNCFGIDIDVKLRY
jgi:hypothetical protein